MVCRVQRKSGGAWFDTLHLPGSQTREIAEWRMRDGKGPVPESVIKAARRANDLLGYWPPHKKAGSDGKNED